MEKVSKKYILEGLDCANCAQKIADKLNKQPWVENASVNFASKTLSVTFCGDEHESEQKCIELVLSVEPDVEIIEKGKTNGAHHSHEHTHHDGECGCGHEHGHEHGHNHSHEHNRGEKAEMKDIAISAAGLVLFGLSYLPIMPFVLKMILLYVGYILTAHEIILSVVKKLKSFDLFDENFLMLVASLGAMIIGEYPEAFAVIVFYEIGEFCQNLAVRRSRKSISSLMDIRPDKARLITENGAITVPPEQVNIGDVIEILPGEKIPLDGELVFGESSIDTSAITGESVPREVFVGDSVLSGCINKTGVIRIRAQRLFGDSTVSKILELLENSGEKKAKSENFITKFARIYTPAVVGAAVLLAIIGGIISGDFTAWVYRALTFLMVSCPCALVLSIPLSYFSAIGASASRGILVKGGNYLEALCKIDNILFDKTGTLTTGSFNIGKIYPSDGYTKEEVLLLAAIAESRSTHPIARSVCNANKLKFDERRISRYAEKSSFGVTAVYDGNTIVAGSAKIMSELNINVRDYSCAVVHVAQNGKYVGTICLVDDIKADAKQTVDELKSNGVSKIVMLTGDNDSAAKAVADKLKIDYHAQLLPQDKVKYVEQYAKEGKTAFVGDGINDAPVLSMADIGIAMGKAGSDSAIEAADVVLMNDKPSLICKAMKIARRTKLIVTENIVFALGVKLIILLLSAFGIVQMWLAVLADVCVALIAVLNAMRLLKIKY